ncbi:glutathione S-transferase family protein [Gemmobacter serpentinus]|uniref:glutathione S-transferase family protein n=1 Tax=Gemmobacter serpentinus TaxID=2652247 RepID=UPI00124E5FFA|nr:glutathione S-transferase [Gemmobacter serpentinus]
MTIRLHHVAGSRSFRILWLLEELGLDYQIIPYRLDDGSTRQADFLALSPLGRVPALEVDGLSIFESGAIAQYLLERHPEAGLAPAPGSAARARFLEWLHFAETQGALLEQLNIQHIFLRPVEARSPVLMKLLTRRLAVTLQAMEARLTRQDSLLEGGFSAADIMLGFNIPAVFRFLSASDYPALAAYGAAMASRPAYLRAMERSGPQALYAKDFYEIPHG